MLPERLILLASATTVGFDDQLGGGKPDWTLDDLGMVLEGLEPLYFKAFAYRWAGDHSARPAIREELLRETAKIATREKWPTILYGERYIEKLVDMALLEEEHPGRFRNEIMAPAIMNVSATVWEKVLSKKYEAIRALMEAWVSIAHSHMISRIRDSEIDILKEN